MTKDVFGCGSTRERIENGCEVIYRSNTLSYGRNIVF
jgi:hypothetical protein